MHPPQHLRRVCWRRASDPGGFAFEAAAVPGAGTAAGVTFGFVAGAGHGTGVWRRQGDRRGAV